MTLAQRATLLPTVTASAAAQRSKTSSALSPNTGTGALLYSLFTPEIGVGYVPDVFGAGRRQVEMAAAEEEATRYQREATYITLVSNVAVAAIQAASARAQIASTESLTALNERSLAVLRELDVAAAEAQLAQLRALRPPLLKQLDTLRDLLAVLAGDYAAEGYVHEFTLDELHLPASLPLSVPSQLLEHRPDVRQAEENLHAAAASVGVAVAARLPAITLTADAGRSALTIGALSSGGTSFWDLGAGLTQPLFNGGALLHRERAARATLEAAEEQYRSTALTAFQNVADALVAVHRDAEALEATTASVLAARTSLDAIRAQRRAGYATVFQESTVTQAYETALLQELGARANRLTDSVALLQALGGGWWNR
jgi:NodT family efflux transporter outer membrane factor (OMF) lipoprotein